MKNFLPLLMKNVLLLLLCSLPGALSSREFNDLSRQTRFTTSLDSDLRRNPALKSTQPQPWHSHSPSDGVSEEDSTSNSQPGTVGDLIDSTQEEDSTVRSLSSQERNGREEDKAVGEERRGKEDETLFGQTTSVYMPTYFSYGTTRRANSRDRVNANRNLRNNNHEVERNSTSFVNFRNANNVGKNSTTSVNNTRSSSTSSVDDTRIEGTGDQKYGWKNSRTVFNGRSNIQENNGTTNSSANSGRSRENSDIGDTTSRRNRYETNVRVTPTLTSNQPTMTYSSDILKLTSPKHSTFGRRANSTDSNYFIKSTTQLPSTNDEVPSSIKSTSFVENPRGGRILTGRRKVNGDESTGVDYLERIQQQIQASTFRPTSYHDEDKNLEYKKKPIKKDTDDVGIVLGGGKGGEKLHVKESAKTETQKAAEVWDEKYKHLKESKDSGKIKEVMTQKPIVDEGYSTIIDTLSKGSGHVPQIIESQKNVTINNEPGTNLLETENVGISKETNEKRETKEKDDESGGDVIPVIIKNSVVGESVNDSLNKSVNFRYPSDVKSGNESLFLSSTLGTNVESEKIENLQTNEKMDLGEHVEVEKDDQEIKKKVYNLKKPLLPPNGGKVDDGFEVMLKNGSADSNDNVAFFSSSVPSLELNKTGINRSGIIDGEKEREEGNRLQKTRISSSTSRITSSFSSNKLASITQHEYTTFASNNLENNIITTSSPLLHGFTSTTPRLKHFFSMRTTTTVQSQPEGNSIKQISSFNPRKRPAVTHYQTTQANPLESHEVEESSTEMQSTKKASYSSTAGYLSSTSMRTNTIRKIVPWSTRLQKTTTMPETTTMDYSDETTLSNKASSFGFADWSKSTPASGDISAVPPTFSTTYSIPTATHVTSETPSWTSVSYSSRTTSRSLEGISSETDSPVLAASGTTSNSSGPPGRLAGSSDTSFNPGRATITYLEKITVPTASSQSFSITTAQLPTSSVEVSSGSSQEKTTSTATSTSDTSVNSSVRWQSTTESGYTSNYPEKSNSSTISNYPSSNSTVTWGIGDTTSDLQANNKIVVESTFEPSTDDLVTRKSDDMFNTTTWSSYEDKNSTEDLQFGDGGGWKSTTAGQDLGTTAREDSSTTAGQDLGTTVRQDLSTTAGQDIGKTAEQDLGTTAGQDLDTTAGQDLGAIAGQDLGTTGGQDSGSTTEETYGGSEEPDDAITTSRPKLTLKSEVNLASTAGMTTPRPYPTSNNNSISKQMFTYRPHSTSNSQPSLTSILSTNLTKLISTSRPHTTSNSNPNITSILSTNLTSTSKPHETEDFFETDDEELHTTTTFPTEGGEYEHGVEDEDDRAMAQTTIKPNKDNRIIQNGSKEEVTTERNNFIMKIPTTESTTWTTDFGEEATTAVRTLPSRADDVSSTTPSSVPIDTEKPSPMQRPIIPVTIEPELATTKPQYMGVSLLIKGSTLQDICNAQHSLKRAIMFLFRNTTGRVLHEDQIVFPSLTSEECNGAKALNSGFHNVDLMLFDENGNLDDELNSEFRMLWENNGLRTNIAIHDVYLILRPTEDEQTSGMTIAVIVIACIGLTCLLLFFILMMVLRKRQKKFNYGQRCTPVSLDDYSLDNISVYNSMRRKNARRASKRSYGNPAFDDPSAPSHQMNFAALAHFCSNRSAIDDEFGDIPMLGAKMDELPPGAETRNRYANVIPLPETRVQLTVRDGDDPVTGYINANYVKGPKGAPKFYIACQAPMQSTVNDFWRMIWEQQSKLVLMLTDLYENGVEKCFDYLPPSEVLDCHRLFGDYQVTLKKREVREKYVISHLQLKNLDSNLWREVTHLWYTSWPHQGTPSEGASMIAYLIEARAYMRHSSGPHIVHCSPGVGRTGTVLAIDLCIREFETSRMVDVPKTVYGLRRNRAGCVQTKDQYAFIYMVLNVYGTKLTGGALDSM